MESANIDQNHMILFIGAHADDVEIAAGATTAILIKRGYRCGLLVVTREKDPKVFKRRSEETIEAAKRLGIEKDLVGCLELADGFVQCNGESVTALRNWMNSRSLNPELVFTHLPNDKHNDHRAVYEIVCSALRNATIVGMPVVNSFMPEHFRPEIFVEVADGLVHKLSSLDAHESQAELGRIMYDAIENLETGFAKNRGLVRTEAFQVLHEGKSKIAKKILQDLNCCSFSIFWKSLLGSDPLVIFSEEFGMDYKDHNPFKEPRNAIEKLRKALATQFRGENDVTEFASSDPMAGSLLASNHVMLTGGAISNLITRDNFNRYPFVRYVVEHDMPRYRNARIIDKKLKRDINAVFVEGPSGEPVLGIDYGILSVFRNPEVTDGRHRTKWMIAAMGIHGWGGVGVMRSLSDVAYVHDYIKRIGVPGDLNGFQVIVRVDVGMQKISVDFDSLELFDLEAPLTSVRYVPVPLQSKVGNL